MFKKLKNKLLYRWLGLNKDMILLDDEKEFLAKAWEEKGFQSFIAYRDLSLLKELGQGLEWNEYNTTLGKRRELLRFASEAKKQFEIAGLDKK